jgi:FkbM family methyltransferase
LTEDPRKSRVRGRQSLSGGCWLSRLSRAVRSATLFGALPHPAGARFLGRGILRANPADARGCAVIRASGVRHAAEAWIWRALVRRLRPETVLDIGANYGEMTLLLPRSIHVHVFEPQQRVWPWLERSLQNRDRATLHRMALSDRDGSAVLHVPDLWSGTASLTGPIRHARFPDDKHEAVPCEVRRLDTLLPGLRGPLVFKIDVEGHELAVLQGMRGTLARAGAFAGLIECNHMHLASAGSSAAALADSLENAGAHVFHLNDGGTLVAGAPATASGDLIVTSDLATVHGLRLPWTLRRSSWSAPEWVRNTASVLPRWTRMLSSMRLGMRLPRTRDPGHDRAPARRFGPIIS